MDSNKRKMKGINIPLLILGGIVLGQLVAWGSQAKIELGLVIFMGVVASVIFGLMIMTWPKPKKSTQKRRKARRRKS